MRTIISTILSYVVWTAVALFLSFGYMYFILGPKTSFWDLLGITYDLILIYIGFGIGFAIALLFILVDVFYLKKTLKNNLKSTIIRFLVMFTITIVVAITLYIL